MALSTTTQKRRRLNLLHLVRPARGGAIGGVIVFAVLLTLGGKPALIGIPAALISLSWFFKYAYIVFDHGVRSLDEPPALDIAMLNPVDEQRPRW
jgi:amino acid transporter